MPRLFTFKFPLFVSLLLANFPLFADIIKTSDCSATSATLTTVKTSNFDISDGLSGGATGSELLMYGPLSPGYYATSCVGLYSGNDNWGDVLTPNLNIGQLGDGLLNGGLINGGGITNQQLFTGLEFITLDDLQDVDGDGEGFPGDLTEDRDDPGWIHLAQFNALEDGGLSSAYSSIGPWNTNDPLAPITLQISDVLRFSFSCNDDGEDDFADCSSLNWTLTTDKDIVKTVQDVLGDSTFDHLAFSVKSGSGNSDGGWAVYDFNFTQIFGNEFFNGNTVFDFTTAYVLGGTLDIGEDFGGKGISHFNVWARDPADQEIIIPEPASIAILALSLLCLGLLKSRRT